MVCGVVCLLQASLGVPVTLAFLFAVFVLGAFLFSLETYMFYEVRNTTTGALKPSDIGVDMPPIAKELLQIVPGISFGILCAILQEILKCVAWGLTKWENWQFQVRGRGTTNWKICTTVSS